MGENRTPNEPPPPQKKKKHRDRSVNFKTRSTLFVNLNFQQQFQIQSIKYKQIPHIEIIPEKTLQIQTK